MPYREGGDDDVIRLSTQPGDMLDASVSCPGAIALIMIVIGLEGTRSSHSEDDITQDFIMQMVFKTGRVGSRL